MKIRPVLAMVCTTALFSLLSCGSESVDADPQTELRVSNALLDLAVDSALVADSVHVYGLRIGDVTVGTLKAGDSTGFYVTDSYGPDIVLSCDSIAVYITVCFSIGGGVDCASRRYVVRDVDDAMVDVRRFEQNSLTIDTSVIPVSELFGQTRVRVANHLTDVTVSYAQSSVQCSTLTLYGIHIGGAELGTAAAGDTTTYVSIDTSGTLAMAIDSVVGTATVLGTPVQLLWTAVDSLTTPVSAFVANTIVLDRSSTALLSKLGAPVIRQ